jgi:hypothetical protein
MSTKKRKPLQVCPEFHEKLINMQRKIRMKDGSDKSIRDITEEIIRSPLFEEIEKKIITSQNLNFDINIKMDLRRR